MAKVLQELELSVRPLREHRSAEWLHNLLDCNRLAGKLILGRTIPPLSGHGDRHQIDIDRTILAQMLPYPPAAGPCICPRVSGAQAWRLKG